MDPNEKKDMNENITNSSAEEQKKDETCIEETSGEVNLQEEKLQTFPGSIFSVVDWNCTMANE